ncbi:hypothetical protein IPH25_02320 [bacterium]|nr:MAG: hypothetical protein IPG37_04460 [bacterium]QQR62258.1 MAG: hypothetical protein IPH25_02320 [bacterium]QQR63176.1 MAG: hypothetical protein IPH67_01745 [bacterium]
MQKTLTFGCTYEKLSLKFYWSFNHEDAQMTNKRYLLLFLTISLFSNKADANWYETAKDFHINHGNIVFPAIGFTLGLTGGGYIVWKATQDQSMVVTNKQALACVCFLGTVGGISGYGVQNIALRMLFQTWGK